MSECEWRATSMMVTVPESRLRDVVPARDNRADGLGGDGGRIGDADSVGIGLYAELHLRTTVGDKAGKRELCLRRFRP